MRPRADVRHADTTLADAQQVLLAEDSEQVRATLASILSRAGYRVLACHDATTAIGIIRDGMPVDLLVTDYAMPGMTGVELALAARSVLPGLPVLIMTGYGEARLRELSGRVSVLRKPFRGHEIVGRLSDLLNEVAVHDADDREATSVTARCA